jgi:hypothetical protein
MNGAYPGNGDDQSFALHARNDSAAGSFIAFDHAAALLPFRSNGKFSNAIFATLYRMVDRGGAECTISATWNNSGSHHTKILHLVFQQGCSWRTAKTDSQISGHCKIYFRDWYPTSRSLLINLSCPAGYRHLRSCLAKDLGSLFAYLSDAAKPIQKTHLAQNRNVPPPLHHMEYQHQSQITWASSAKAMVERPRASAFRVIA